MLFISTVNHSNCRTMLFINHEGCVNTLQSECSKFYEEHGKNFCFCIYLLPPNKTFIFTTQRFLYKVKKGRVKIILQQIKIAPFCDIFKPLPATMFLFSFSIEIVSFKHDQIEDEMTFLVLLLQARTAGTEVVQVGFPASTPRTTRPLWFAGDRFPCCDLLVLSWTPSTNIICLS